MIEKERAFFSNNVYGGWDSNHGVYTDFFKVFAAPQRYRSFITRIAKASASVMVLATTTGQAPSVNP